MPERKLVGWKVAKLSADVASIRYRAMLPVLELEGRGMDARIFSHASPDNLQGLDCLVIVKSFTPDDFFLVCAAHKRGIPVVIDLCDNIFIEGYGKKAGVRSSLPALHFDQMAALASAVVVTTAPLADVVRSRLGDGCRVFVIPDGIEDERLLARMVVKLRAAAHREREGISARSARRFTSLRRRMGILRTAELGPYLLNAIGLALRSRRQQLLRRLASRPNPDSRVAQRLPAPAATGQAANIVTLPVKRILWFGHHGASYARFGVVDLLTVQADLEAIAAEFDVELVVVTNSPAKYEQLVRPMAIPSRYVEWSSDAVQTELRRAAVTIIPNSLDAFSLCKSANRAVLSLLSGVPVVATRTPALQELDACLTPGDFREGLRTCLGSSPEALVDREKVRAFIDSLYGGRIIGDRWQEVIDSARVAAPRDPGKYRLAIVIQMPLDWLLLRPVVEEALARGTSVLGIVNLDLPGDPADICAKLTGMGAGLLPVRSEHVDTIMLPASLKALLFASESSLVPHRFAHRLARKGAAAGLFTATMQHGYEAPGLTYHDWLHSARKIRFASKRVYLWGDMSTLCSTVPRATAAKCLPVGGPPLPRAAIPALHPGTPRQPVIGIFENLHWHRYPESYRAFFMAGVAALAQRFTDVRFVVHTHPAGRWLTSRESRELAGIDNLVLVDPDGDAATGESLARILAGLDGIISTPSSVVVHAAQRGLPVGLVSAGVDTARYAPLFDIAVEQDWFRFVNMLRDDAERQTLQQKSGRFVAAALHPADSVVRIVDDLFRNM
jgi:glycosyltransferase involved in cell wall biosynthesis